MELAEFVPGNSFPLAKEIIKTTKKKFEVRNFQVVFSGEIRRFRGGWEEMLFFLMRWFVDVRSLAAVFLLCLCVCAYLCMFVCCLCMYMWQDQFGYAGSVDVQSVYMSVCVLVWHFCLQTLFYIDMWLLKWNGGSPNICFNSNLRSKWSVLWGRLPILLKFARNLNMQLMEIIKSCCCSMGMCDFGKVESH